MKTYTVVLVVMTLVGCATKKEDTSWTLNDEFDELSHEQQRLKYGSDYTACSQFANYKFFNGKQLENRFDSYLFEYCMVNNGWHLGNNYEDMIELLQEQENAINFVKLRK